MSANPTIYCLQHNTDYFEFERLCHDLMTLRGYSGIKPLGQFKDKGRDAIHVDDTGKTTIFAYSVRENWRAKLSEDASKIHKHSHTSHRLVFVTTSNVGAGEHDEAVTAIRNQYGWELDLYPAERLRTMLDAEFPQVKKNYLHIFRLEAKGEPDKSPSNLRDHILLSACAADGVLVAWLQHKLTCEGYRVWSTLDRPFSDVPIGAAIEDLLAERVCCAILVYSVQSVSDPDAAVIRVLANQSAKKYGADFVIPIQVSSLEEARLDSQSRQLTFVAFDNWAHGLTHLLRRLSRMSCPKTLDDGKQLTAKLFIEETGLRDQREAIVSNILKIVRCPREVYDFETTRTISRDLRARLRYQWAFRSVSPNQVLAFHAPSEAIAQELGLRMTQSFEWADQLEINGINTRNLVAELLRKSIEVKAWEKGLRYCAVQKLLYFPYGLLPNNRLTFRQLYGKGAWLAIAGERKFFSGKASEYYRYYLAPSFRVTEIGTEFVILLRIHVRLADANGEPFIGRKVNSRRKHLCLYFPVTDGQAAL